MRKPMKNRNHAKFLLIALTFFCISTNVQAIDVYPTSLDDLQGLSGSELTEVYTTGTAFEIPSTSNPGEELLLTGLPLPIPGLEGPSNLLNFFWGGKVFITDALGATTLTNKIFPTTPFSFNNVSADVSIVDNSLTNDGMPVIALNYESSNIVIARAVRDEIRLVAPGLYLGRAYLKNGLLTRLLTGKQHTFVLWFALEDLN